MKVLQSSKVLNKMVTSGITLDPSGNQKNIHSGIRPPEMEALYTTIIKAKPNTVIEVGMAYGISTLAILTALRDLGGKRKLISIDPFQETVWNNCALESIRRDNLQDLHEHVSEMSCIALPELLKSGVCIELGYIDGWHTFDYALLDFWYLDRMLLAGGIIGVNDCGYPAVHKMLHFIKSHRRYCEIAVGLSHNCFKILAKAALGTLKGYPPSISFRKYHDRYFRKIEVWEPNYDFFRNF